MVWWVVAGWWEDPRACGDDRIPRSTDVLGEGRSPRVRGRLLLDGCDARLLRKIPARAGTTSGRGIWWVAWPEDPRAYGDDDWSAAYRAAELGRSPRVRGRRVRSDQPAERIGKIPARAGTTTMRCPRLAASPEDPRACGDDQVSHVGSGRGAGRSPRVRGRPRDLFRGQMLFGKIPACAGTTAGPAPDRPALSEDPRACGDDSPAARVMARGAGRSPRVRGRPLVKGDAVAGGGKIPARAGTTLPCHAARRSNREDPRACGDDRPASGRGSS